METIKINIEKQYVYTEVAKATDYVGSKLEEPNDTARDRILASDEELNDMERFWAESIAALTDRLKEMVVSDEKGADGYKLTLEVSRSFDKALTPSVESALRSYFIASIIGQWFKFANKGEAADYLTQAAEMVESAERLLYSRKRPTLPSD